MVYNNAKEIILSALLNSSELLQLEGAEARKEGVKRALRNKHSLLSLKLDAADPKPVRSTWTASSTPDLCSPGWSCPIT